MPPSRRQPERLQLMVAEQRERETLFQHAIVEWLIQPALDPPCPLEFLICEIINSLLFKPGLSQGFVSERKATENYQLPIPEAAHGRRQDLGGGGDGIQDI